MRNLDRKHEYDRDRYAQKRKDDPLAVRNAERDRKRKQRSRKIDPHFGAMPLLSDTVDEDDDVEAQGLESAYVIQQGAIEGMWGVSRKRSKSGRMIHIPTPL